MGAWMWISFGLGLVLLTLGGEGLVRGASSLAQRFGISPLVVGLTVVAFGTSAPELVVGLIAASKGTPDIAVGNVVGSNIMNVLLILGVSALIAPLVVDRQLLKRDLPVMIAASLFIIFFGFDGTLSVFEGLVMFLGGLGFTIFVVRQSRGERSAASPAPSASSDDGKATAQRPLVLDLLFVGLGLAALVLGADWVVKAAVQMALALGIDEATVGLTVVAVGTSLPELATSVVATFRGERDIAVGNIVGSNIYNLLLVLSLTAVAAGGLEVAPSLESFDIPVMIAVAVATLPLFAAAQKIVRWQGALFLAAYLAYSIYLVLASRQHPALGDFRELMLGYVIPAGVLVVAALLLRLHHHHETSVDEPSKAQQASVPSQGDAASEGEERNASK